MPARERPAMDIRRLVKSRLGESLLRLQHNLDQTRHNAVLAQDQFDTWQERWSHRREQIARRLELIDSQLEQLAQSNLPRPQLAVVGTGEEESALLAGIW